VNSALPLHMADNPETPEPFSLKRWSQRKRAAALTNPAESSPSVLPVADDPAAAAIATVDTAPAAMPEASSLPPVDSLTFESDYSAFMQPKIDEGTKRAALKKLFSNPSFNAMDGLDIYVGDYTQPDPMPAGMLEKLSAVYAMLDPVEPAQDDRVAAGNLPAPADATPVAATDASVTAAAPAHESAMPVAADPVAKPGAP
jgi:hypothetical protein